MKQDTKRKITSHTIFSRSLPQYVAVEELRDAANPVNSDNPRDFKSKRIGSVLVVLLERGVMGGKRKYSLAIATEGGPEGAWYVPDLGTVVPEYKEETKPVVRPKSDSKQDISFGQNTIAAGPFSVYKMEEIRDAYNIINDRHYSGKRAGSFILIKDNTLGIPDMFCLATGSSDTAPWWSSAKGIETPTYSGTPPVQGKQLNYPAQVNGDFPLLTKEELLYTDQTDLWEAIGKRPLGSTVILYDPENLKNASLMYLDLSDEGEYVWYDLGTYKVQPLGTGYFPSLKGNEATQ